MFLQRLVHLFSMAFLFVAILSTTKLQANDDLTNEQLHAVMGIITNFILNNEPVVLKKTGQITSYGSKDDGYYQIGLQSNYTRNNNVVTDYITGLEWQDNIESQTITKNWLNAQDYCNNLNLDGGNWRLPSTIELLSIITHRGGSRLVSDTTGSINIVYNMSIDTTYFHYTESNISSPLSWWSSTTDTSSSSDAWYVNFYIYGFTSTSPKTTNLHVRCVR